MINRFSHPDDISAWVCRWRDRLGLSVTEAGRALGLENPNEALRKYESGAKWPSMSLIRHMELLETLSVAAGFISSGRITAAKATLQETLMDRVPTRDEVVESDPDSEVMEGADGEV